MQSLNKTTRATAVLLGILLAVLLFPAGASAEVPPFFTQIPENSASGEGAGQLNNPQAVESDPATGHIYVAEYQNARISEFNIWGQFVKAWGWGVDTGAEELQTCTAGSGCQAGSHGAGAGQFGKSVGPLGGLAVDSEGNVYVGDIENHRVEKFNSDGEFLLMFGGGVDKTTNADICTQEDLENGDECGAGTTGTGNAQWSAGRVGDKLAYDPVTNSIWVGDINRLQQFSTDGTYQSQVALPLEKEATSVAVDPESGAPYVTLFQSVVLEVSDAPYIYKYTGSSWTHFAEVGNPEATPFPIHGFPTDLATDAAGNVYVTARETQTGSQPKEQVLEFKADGTCVICQSDLFAESKTAELGEPPLYAVATNLGCGLTGADLYVARYQGNESFLDAYGPVPDPTLCPPPQVPPTISEEFASSVGTDNAILGVAINPRFWSGSLGETRYYVEYGTAPCAESGCTAQPAPPGAKLIAEAVNKPVRASGIFIGNLQPDTTYYYRFIATSTGGGPVTGQEHTFTTSPLALGAKEDCVNQAFRTAAAANLPDCRAYEMVSPVDKAGGDVVVQANVDDIPAGLAQSAVDGKRLTYSSYRPFGAAESAPYTLQYLAERGSDGWSSRNVSPPISGSSPLTERRDLDNEYKAFGQDVCSAVLLQFYEPTLDPAAPSGFAGAYRRNVCTAPSYESLITTVPEHAIAARFLPEIQGTASEDDCVVFRVAGKLTSNASDAVDLEGKGNLQVYENCGGVLRLVSVLPNGSANTSSASVGTSGRDANHDTSLWHAMSTDGSRIYWSGTALSAPLPEPAPLYVRVNATQEQSVVASGKCTEATKACTYLVAPLSAQPLRFWAADPSGSKALYSVGTKLFEYKLKAKSSTLIAEGVQGVLGASEDLSRIYLVSTEVLSGGDQGPSGEAPAPGALNLYLDEESSFRFVGRLAAGDLRVSGTVVPSERAVRVTPDGSVLAFNSSAQLTGYDNTDLHSGNADTEVFVYNAGTGPAADALACVSCNPTGARPVGRDIAGVSSFNSHTLWAAANVPPWPSQLEPSRPLADDGSRLFFESYDSLVQRDTNGTRDVYEWESAGSQAECIVFGAELYSPKLDGCLSLISSGKSPDDSEFVEATPSSSDVFLATAQSLLLQDPGLVDIYDARVGGGFPPPPPAAAACEGEACQGIPNPPSDATPASAAFVGAGNVHKAPHHPCRHGKVRRHGKCVKHRHRHRHAGHRRAAK